MSIKKKTLVVLGASGDLTARLLLPGLGQYLASGRAGDIELIGVGSEDLTIDQWRERVATSFAAGGAGEEHGRSVTASSSYIRADATDPTELEKIFASCAGAPVLYFALPPAVTEKVCAALATFTLPSDLTLALEKPFGTDLESARLLNARLASLLPESSVYRIDHFLGKSTVLNLLGLRFANRLFEQSWNATNVERVEISYDEKLGLESRAGYYDKAGALVDMIQSHLLQVLALVAMEAPSTIHADDLRGAMAQALRATRVWDGNPAIASRRARYTAGTIDGRPFGDYAEEPGVEPDRETETLAEISFAIENWRWAGVPFVLRSGKALSDSRKDIVITFKEVPHLPGGLRGKKPPTQLRISLGPNGVALDVNINGEGDPFELEQVTMDATIRDSEMGPYGEVLEGILTGDATLSVRADVAEECWRIVAPVLSAWKDDAVRLDSYPAGSAGPAEWKPLPSSE